MAKRPIPKPFPLPAPFDHPNDPGEMKTPAVLAIAERIGFPVETIRGPDVSGGSPVPLASRVSFMEEITRPPEWAQAALDAAEHQRRLQAFLSWLERDDAEHT